ncbi:hypothetical protein GQ55_6G281000 [Panicum hallii var. hallii]|uniref:Uncharacterized protein n=1 Tax=Panicum hallii var. hallii TaxID=1504633 RepID=A0A2T7DAG1_9POAL|nr:hypothetical protein GQ55_6G281000 [Panicum hallii var. hallii]
MRSSERSSVSARSQRAFREPPAPLSPAFSLSRVGSRRPRIILALSLAWLPHDHGCLRPGVVLQCCRRTDGRSSQTKLQSAELRTDRAGVRCFSSESQLKASPCICCPWGRSAAIDTWREALTGRSACAAAACIGLLDSQLG